MTANDAAEPAQPDSRNQYSILSALFSQSVKACRASFCMSCSAGMERLFAGTLLRLQTVSDFPFHSQIILFSPCQQVLFACRKAPVSHTASYELHIRTVRDAHTHRTRRTCASYGAVSSKGGSWSVIRCCSPNENIRTRMEKRDKKKQIFFFFVVRLHYLCTT